MGRENKGLFVFLSKRSKILQEGFSSWRNPCGKAWGRLLLTPVTWRDAMGGWKGRTSISWCLQRAWFIPAYLKADFPCRWEKCLSLKQPPGKKHKALGRRRKNEVGDGRFHASTLKPAENLHYSSVAFWCFPYYIGIWLFSLYLLQPGSSSL